MRGEAPEEVAEGERQYDSDDRDGERRGPDPKHLAQVGLQPDLEEQQEHTELGEHVNQLGLDASGRHDAEHTATQQDTGEQLAQDGGLAHALGGFAEQLGGREDRRQHQEEARDVHSLGGGNEGQDGDRDGHGDERAPQHPVRGELRRGGGGGRCA
jgi:hypothetical protein